MIKNLEIYERVLQEANYLIVNNATVRQTAKVFGVSKSCWSKLAIFWPSSIFK